MKKITLVFFIIFPVIVAAQKVQEYVGLNKTDNTSFTMKVEELSRDTTVTHIRLTMSSGIISALVDAFQYKDSTVTHIDGVRSGTTFPVSMFYNLKLGHREVVDYAIGNQKVRHSFEKLSQSNGVNTIRDILILHDSLKPIAKLITLIRFKEDYNFPETTEVIKLDGCNEVIFNTVLIKKN